MLVYFSAENFKSIKEPIELDMRAAPRLRRLNTHVRTPAKDKKLKVLKSAVMYGANASGKSNIIKAMSFARKMIVEHSAPNKPINFEHFRLIEAPSEVSSFYFEFVVGDLHFGFGVEFDRERILEERLTILEFDDEQVLYHRKHISGENYLIKGMLFVSDDEEELLQQETQELAMLAKFTAKNRLFLSECAERNVFDKLKSLSHLLHVPYYYFQKCLVIIYPDTEFAGLIDMVNSEDDTFEQDLISLLSQFDTGLAGIKPVAIETSNFSKDVLDKLATSLAEGEIASIEGVNEKYHAQLNEQGELEIYSLNSIHQLPCGVEIAFDLNNESDGTLRLLDLLPTVLEQGVSSFRRTFIIDEFDRSLHPNLARSFIDLFLNSKHSDDDNQLIVSTHEAELLDNNLLRRDEIWFVQKEWDFSTKLYSLNDYSTRFDKDIHRAYLDGKFGAVPMLMEDFRKS